MVTMGDLKPEMTVITWRGPPLVVRSVTQEQHPEGIAVYNLEVEGDHTYFVGTANGGTWVHNTCVALDRNAIIALLEGSPADQTAVRTAIGGRTPVVSITAAKEFLAGGGDVNALRSFLASNGGRIGAAGDASTVSGLMSSGLKAGDARVVGSAMREGVPLITRDKRLLKKIPGIGVGF